MYKFLFLLLASAYCQQTQPEIDVESVLEAIFGPTSAPMASPSPPVATNPTVPSALEDKKGESSTLVAGIQTSDDQDTACTTDKGEEGECVPYYLCNKHNNTVITDGVGIIDNRGLRSQLQTHSFVRRRRGLNSLCSSHLDTCCLVGEKKPPLDPEPLNYQEPGDMCGWWKPKGLDLIPREIEDESEFGEFPWMVAIFNVKPVNDQEPDGKKLNVYLGGGSLIHPSVVLSAAHYVAAHKSLRVRAGEWDLTSTKEIYPYQDRDVESVEIHEEFNKENQFYDISLLFLSKPMELTPNVGVVCLPFPMSRPEAGTRCFATGWGKDSFGIKGRYQTILKKIELPLVSRYYCQELLQRTSLGRHFKLHTSFICAGGELGRDMCLGDGGSPLVCPIAVDKGRYIQSGIVAWGIGCGGNGIPGVYVDVANLRDWIDGKVHSRGHDSSVYTYYFFLILFSMYSSTE